MAESTRLLRTVAIHEAGHVIAAHLRNFIVKSVHIFENGEGGTIIDYGTFSKDASYVLNLDKCHNTAGYRKNADPAKLADFDELVDSLCFILLAGGVAESIYMTPEIVDNNHIVVIDGTDKSRVEDIVKLLELDIDIQCMTEALFTLMKDQHISAAIEEISNKMTASKDNTLHKDDIEAILLKYDFT